MQEFFDNVRAQLHEIRNLVGPVDLKLANLEHQFAETRVLFEEKAASLESKLLANTFRLDEHTTQISGVVSQNVQLSERVSRIEMALKLVPTPAKETSSPAKEKPLAVHKDKSNPGEVPPQGPAR